MDDKNFNSNLRPRTWDDAVAAFEDELDRKGRAGKTIAAYGAVMRDFGKFYQAHLKKPGPHVSRLQETDKKYIKIHRDFRPITFLGSMF